ncbi:hypothetical protein [Desulfoscipio sp. XC116]|uniref:hypothetical protein n=1 Tax=Desulfoscipio sp. XC116 TaxID=3144975 RepID=UPI00325AE2BB
MINKISIINFILTIVIAFLVIIATAFGTIKVMDYRESALLDNEIKTKIGVESFEELDHIERKIVINTKYYKKDGTLIIEEKETSESTINYNH